MKLLYVLSLGVLGLSLQACTVTGALVGAAATTGIAAAQEGGLKRAVSDVVIQAKINELWLQADTAIFTKLDLTVNQGRVLVTGVVQNPEHRVEAVRLAWKPTGVKQVINEVQVAKSKGVTGFARDKWAATRLRGAITLDRDVQSINYNIDVVQSVVYLMGVAQNQAELNRVIETARTIPDVKRVVSYVKLAGVQSQDYRPETFDGSSAENVSQSSTSREVFPDPQARQSVYDTRYTDPASSPTGARVSGESIEIYTQRPEFSDPVDLRAVRRNGIDGVGVEVLQ